MTWRNTPKPMTAIAERLLQQKIEFYNSLAMERGLIVEADAADWCEFDQDVTTQRVGFITDDYHTTGCSPDRLVGEDGLLEIKAPLPHSKSNTGFPESSTNAFGRNCRVSSTSLSAAGSISCAGTMCSPTAAARVALLRAWFALACRYLIVQRSSPQL
jgi:hypothetical protein